MKKARLRAPASQDGAHLHELIAACPPLDLNSTYCYLLQCSHFSGTSVVAEQDGRLLGAITGYLVPERPDTLFIWQVAVHPDGRGQGLAGRMLRHLLERPGCAGVRYLETTVTAGNTASWRLFEGFARSVHAPLVRRELFHRDRHFGGRHDTEILARIGAFGTRAPDRTDNRQPDKENSVA